MASPAQAGTGLAGGGSAGAGFANSSTPAQAPTDPVSGTAGVASAPDQPTSCGGVEITPMVATKVVPGNLLVIFDESLSMNELWGSSGQDKWTVASAAVIEAFTPLADKLSAGSLFFPNAGLDLCGVSAIDSGSQIGFMPGPAFMSAWNAYMSNHGPSGFTPTGAAMRMADAALSKSALSGTTAVVVITDGDPNCNTNDSDVDQLAADWLQKGIKTHVFGLPGADAGASRLSALAVSGGTMQFITPSDSDALKNALAQIAGEAVTTTLDSCSIDLPKAPPNPADVKLVVVEKGVKQSVARDLGTGGGWMLDSSGLRISLQGPFCDQAKLGTYEKISVVFGCVDVPPLPPPKPPS